MTVLTPEPPSTGIDAATRELFGAPATPSESLPELARRIFEEAKERGLSGELRLAPRPLRRDTLFDALGRKVTFPEGTEYARCHVGLLDLDPQARWAHDARWVFVPLDGGPIAFVEGTMHEHSAAPFLPIATP